MKHTEWYYGTTISITEKKTLDKIECEKISQETAQILLQYKDLRTGITLIDVLSWKTFLLGISK